MSKERLRKRLTCNPERKAGYAEGSVYSHVERSSAMSEKTQEVREHYNLDPKKEWDRLQIKHPHEKYITIHMMDRYIKPGDKILDIGGGPGHYGIHYAGQGHGVTLLDLSDENVRFAKKKARQYGVKMQALQGDAMDLPEEQELFDIAAKGEGLSFKAFTHSHMATVGEAKELLASIPGLQTVTVFGQESILAAYKNTLKASTKKVRQAWYDYALKFCEKEDYLTHSEHLMIVSKKQA